MVLQSATTKNKFFFFFWSDFSIFSLHADEILNVDAEVVEGIVRGKNLCMQNTKSVLIDLKI